MKSITSVHNPKIKDIIALHSASQRQKEGLFLAEGLRTIITLAQSIKPVTLFVTEKMIHQAQALVDQDDICIVSDSVMHKISTTTTAPGIIGVFAIPKPKQPLTEGLVLADITDPGNVGTLIRTAVACNVKTVVTVEGTDIWSPKVVNATAGSIASVAIYRYTWSELIERKRASSLKLYGLIVSGGASIRTVDKKDALLVVGNEAHGIKPEWLRDCDYTITLPMAPHTESLNAAIAGSIALYISHMAY